MLLDYAINPCPTFEILFAFELSNRNGTVTGAIPRASSNLTKKTKN